MQTQSPAQQNATSSAQGILGFSFIMLFCCTLQQAAALLGDLLCGWASQFLHALPWLLLAVWRLLGSQALDLERFCGCYRMLASFVPLAHCLLAMTLR